MGVSTVIAGIHDRLSAIADQPVDIVELVRAAVIIPHAGLSAGPLGQILQRLLAGRGGRAEFDSYQLDPVRIGRAHRLVERSNTGAVPAIS